jgi:Fe-S-cluster-containing hydrogenase component 2
VTIKCDYCDGDPQCVSFCTAKAVSYVEPDQLPIGKKREAGAKYMELMARR